MIIEDEFEQPIGVGDVIVYVTVSGSSPTLTRAEVVEIAPKKSQYDHYRMRVRPERGPRSWGTQREFVWLTRAPILKVANAVDFEEYREGLLQRYEPLHESSEEVS